MSDLQQRVNDWQAVTFPHSISASVLAHFEREVREFLKDGDPEEAADIVMLLFAFAGKQGFDLLEQVERKFAICQERQWQAPDEHGVVEHVREVTA